MTRTNKSVLKSFFAASPVHLNLDVDRDGVLKQFDQPLLPNFLRYMDGSPPGAGVWEPPTEAESIYLDVPVRMSAAQLGTGTPAAGGGAVPAVAATPGVPTPAEDDDKFLRDLKKKAFLSYTSAVQGMNRLIRVHSMQICAMIRLRCSASMKSKLMSVANEAAVGYGTPGHTPEWVFDTDDLAVLWKYLRRESLQANLTLRLEIAVHAFTNAWNMAQKPDQAWKILAMMRQAGLEPDADYYATAIAAATSVNLFDDADRLHREAVKLNLGSALAAELAKQSTPRHAQSLYFRPGA
jgi:hypothetical protein